MTNVLTDIVRDLELLHPVVLSRVRALLDAATEAHARGEIPAPLGIFETYRHPLRQRWLGTQGTTNAGIWQSAHQFGLAADFVPRPYGRWTWDGPDAGRCFDWLDANVRKHGLCRPLKWDRPHVEWPEWATFRNGLDAAARLKPSGV